MSHDEILREITSEAELARHDGGGDWWDDMRKAYYEASQFAQCTGLKDCGGCDPNGVYKKGSSKPSSSKTFHC